MITMLAGCLVVTSLNACLCCQEAAESNATPAERYAHICAEYELRMAQAREEKKQIAVLRDIGRWRRDSLTELITDAKEMENTSALMTAEDYVALAVAAEAIRAEDDCIRYARLATSTDPQAEGAYRPLIRTLLNLRKLDDAEAAVFAAEVAIPDLTKWRGMRFFLFKQSRREKQWERAAMHLTAYMQRVAGELDTGARYPRELRAALKSFVDVCRQAEKTTESQALLRSWRAKCDAAICEVDENRHIDHCMLLEHMAALWQLRCELAIACRDESLGEPFLRWVAEVLEEKWDTCETKINKQREELVRYLEARLEEVDSLEDLNEGLVKLRLSIEGQSNSASEEPKIAIIRRLLEVATNQAEGNSTGH